MAPRDNEADHKKLLDLLPTVVPGTLYETIRQAFGFAQGASVHGLIKRLRSAGYDMTRYDIEASRRDKSERRLESIAKARAAKTGAKTNPPTRSPAKTTPTKVPAKTKPELLPIREELLPIRPPETAQNQARAKTPDLVSVIVSDAPEHAKKRREEWLREMRAVSDWPNATALLAAAWQTDVSTVYSRIAVLRQVGYDLSFWTPSPSRPVQERTVPKSVPSGSIPMTVSALSEIAGVPYSLADEIADRIGVPLLSGFCPVRGRSISARAPVSPEQATRILSRLGFVRRSRLAQEFPSWEMS